MKFSDETLGAYVDGVLEEPVPQRLVDILRTVPARAAKKQAVRNPWISREWFAKACHTPIRIGLSFRDKQGDYCRTFSLQHGRDLAGLACRQHEQWQVQVLARHSPSPNVEGGAEPAGSALPAAVLSAVEERISGEPLDTSGEAAARQSHWRAH